MSYSRLPRVRDERVPKKGPLGTEPMFRDSPPAAPTQVVRRLHRRCQLLPGAVRRLPLPIRHPTSRPHPPRARESARTVYIVVRGSLGYMGVDSSRLHFYETIQVGIAAQTDIPQEYPGSAPTAQLDSAFVRDV